MDDLDKRILAELQKNARVAFREIANKNGISIGTVHNRLKKLKKEGVLLGYVPVIDSQKLGYTIIALVYIKVEGGHLQEIQDELKSFKEINVIYQTSGIYDLVLIARFKDMMDDFSEFNKKISKLKYMKSEMNLVLDTLKDDYYVKL